MYSSIPLLKNTGKGLNVQYKGIFLYSTIDPEGSVLRRIDRITINKNTLLFIPSPGLGYGLSKLLKIMPSGTHILCVETDQLLMKLLIDYKYKDISADSRLSIIRVDDPASAVNYFKGLRLNSIRRVQTIHLSRGYQIYPEIYNYIEKAIEETIEHFWQNRITLINMNALWIKNVIDNLPYISKCQNVSSLFIKKPILITGAGPSLEENLKTIKKFKEKYTLISVDTALPILGAMNITPDFIFVLDAQISNISDFIPYRFPKARLITDLTVHPVIFRKFNFKSIYLYHSSFAEFSFFKRMDSHSILPLKIPPLGSVGAAAVYIALSVSSGPIFLAGLDFSYPGGKTHADGSTFHLIMQLENMRLKPLANLNFSAIINRPLKNVIISNNKQIKTDLVLNNYAQQLNEILRNQNRVFNLSLEPSLLQSPAALSEKQLIELIETVNSSTTFKQVKKQRAEYFLYENVKKFVRNEISILTISSEKIRDYLNASPMEQIKLQEKIFKYLEITDFIYGGFPDTYIKKNNNRSFLKRLYIGLIYHLNRIKRIDNLL